MEVLLHLSNPPPPYRRIANLLADGLPTSPPQRRPKGSRQVQTRLTPERLAQLLERYRKGERAFQLATAFGLNRKTVGEILKRAGVRRPRSLTPEQIAEVKELRKQGWSYARIGKHLKKDGGTVWLALRNS